MRDEFPALNGNVRVLPIEVDDGKEKIQFLDGDPAETLNGQSVLLLDGAIHSGGMMSLCAKEVLKYDPAELGSYALVIKRGSAFIPTLWGVMMEETDRAFFLLDAIPNNRLDAAGHNPQNTKKQPLVHIERLNERMLDMPPVKSGVGSMDRMKWSDRHFQMVASDHLACTYVLAHGKTITSYISMHRLENGGLMIDEIAVDLSQQKKGYGGVLMRFADTLARQGNCPVVRLLAIKKNVEFYKAFEFRPVEGKESIRLDDEEYWPMEKAVLYHHSPVR